MSNDLEAEIISFGLRITKVEKIQEVESFFSEMNERYENAEKDKLTKKVRKLMCDNFILTVDKIRDFYDKWGESGVLPSDKEELNAAERFTKKILEILDKIDGRSPKYFQSFFDENYRSEAKKGLIKFRVMVYEEKY